MASRWWALSAWPSKRYRLIVAILRPNLGSPVGPDQVMGPGPVPGGEDLPLGAEEQTRIVGLADGSIVPKPRMERHSSVKRPVSGSRLLREADLHLCCLTWGHGEANTARNDKCPKSSP